MKKQLFFAVSMVFALVFSSCSKDLTALDPSLFKCNPNPLEVKGGKVDATVTGTFPVKYFNKRAVLTVTPVLKFEGKEVKGTPVVFQGEKVKGNDKTINFKAGGNYSVKASFDYVPEMAKSELYLEFNVVQKKKNYQIPSVKVADGVIATSQLVSTNATEMNPVIIPDKFQRVIQQQQQADIMFLIQQSKLRKSETSSADMISLTNKIKEAKESSNQQVSGFDLSAYASPEGPLKLNTNLAESREKVTVDFMNKQLKKLRTSVKIDSKFTPEDWEGFQALMEKSNIQDKQVILRVLTMYTDPEERNRQIKNLSVAFKQIAEEILPQLRRSKLKLTVDVTGKADSVISKLAKEDPSKLNVEELLYAATLTTDLGEKAAIYQKVTEQFPSDVRGFNNLGAVKFEQGNVDDASRYIAKALEIEPANADVNYNAGLTSLAKGDIAKSEEYFGKAAGTTGNVGQGLGTIYLIKGDYSKAKTYFGATASNNTAIVQILNADYNGARTTLSTVAHPNGLTSYLGAIVGARTNDRDAVYSNLKTAIKLDGTFAQKAAKDIEFSKFATDETFLSIIK
jgi:Tfp pilus assembly protein PilF